MKKKYEPSILGVTNRASNIKVIEQPVGSHRNSGNHNVIGEAFSNGLKDTI